MYEKFIKKIYSIKNSNNTIEYLKLLEKTQWFDKNKIYKIQQQKMKVLMKHAYFNVPYYHKIFDDRNLKPDDIKTVEDLIKLPILTKENIRNNFNRIIARNLPRYEMIPSQTGGSSGVPLRFFLTRESKDWSNAAALRAYQWAGYELGDKQAIVWGSPIDLSLAQEYKNRIKNILLRNIILDSSSMSEKSMKKFVEKLNRFKPKIIRGYSSGIYVFAKFLEANNIQIKTEAVITTAESLNMYQKNKIENIFKCKVYDFYGSREIASIASECSEKHGYHISSENVILEIIKDNEQVINDETGNIIITNLNNYALPFIRYEIGDLGKNTDETCSCGRGLPLLRSLEGRNTDIIITRDGNFVTSVVLTLIFGNLPVKKYQIIQESYDDFIVNIVKENDYSHNDTNNIIKGMSKYIKKDINVKINFVDLIEPAKSGKNKIIISKIPLSNVFSNSCGF
ncbi:MAG: phenylacetate--CoA ligase family protein [Candidatus Hodarchaeota archaeon]